MKASGIHIRAISQEMPQPSITKIHVKITNLKFHSNLPGANELWFLANMAVNQKGCNLLSYSIRCFENTHNWPPKAHPKGQHKGLSLWAQSIIYAYERWCYTITPFLIGWAHIQNNSCQCFLKWWPESLHRVKDMPLFKGDKLFKVIFYF